MSDNLPAVRVEPATLVRRDTDSWAEQLPAIVDLARSICGTDFVPEALRDNVAATAAAILYGRELGLAPMTALTNVHVIKGTPALSARMQRAAVLAAGHGFRVVESNAARAVVEGRRRGDEGAWTRASYDFEEAKRAGLVKDRGGWATNPVDMCFARASSRLCRQIFTDVIMGLPTPEDLEDEPSDEGVKREASPTTKVQRRRRSGAPEPGPAALGGDPVPVPPLGAGSPPPLPPLPGEEDEGGSGVAPATLTRPVPGPPSQTDDGADALPADRSQQVEATGTPAPSSASEAAEVRAKFSERESKFLWPNTSAGAGVHAEASDAAPEAADQKSGTRTGESAPADPQYPSTTGERGILMAQFERLGFTDTDEDRLARFAVAEAIINRPVTTMGRGSDLTHGEYRQIYAVVSRVKDREKLTEVLVALAQTETQED